MDDNTDRRLDILESLAVRHTNDIERLLLTQTKQELAMVGLVAKLDKLIEAGIKTQATFETVLTMVKASPAVIAILAVLLGGIAWMIKHV